MVDGEVPYAKMLNLVYAQYKGIMDRTHLDSWLSYQIKLAGGEIREYEGRRMVYLNGSRQTFLENLESNSTMQMGKSRTRFLMANMNTLLSILDGNTMNT